MKMPATILEIGLQISPPSHGIVIAITNGRVGNSFGLIEPNLSLGTRYAVTDITNLVFRWNRTALLPACLTFIPIRILVEDQPQVPVGFLLPSNGSQEVGKSPITSR
jgi:hypothetical protein